MVPYWGTTQDRKVLRKFWNPELIHTEDASFHVVVTSYQLIIQDVKYFQRIRWHYMILDEAQAIKNTSRSVVTVYRQLVYYLMALHDPRRGPGHQEYIQVCGNLFCSSSWGPFKCYVTLFFWKFDTHPFITLITLNRTSS